MNILHIKRQTKKHIELSRPALTLTPTPTLNLGLTLALALVLALASPNLSGWKGGPEGGEALQRLCAMEMRQCLFWKPKLTE